MLVNSEDPCLSVLAMQQTNMMMVMMVIKGRIEEVVGREIERKTES